MAPRRILVIGGGFSGAALAIQLLRRTRCAVDLVDSSGVFGRGLAYSTPWPEHLLNVRAGRMSLHPDQPDHFVRWLAAAGRPEGPDDFAPRGVYGDYVQAELAAAEAAAPARLNRVSARALAVAAGEREASARLADGRLLRGDAVVLALGNGAPASLDLPGIAALGEAHLPDPWAPGALESIGPDEDVVLVGAGLTMIDVLLALDARGWKGHALALSRRGLLPRSHPDQEQERSGPPPGGGSLSDRLRTFRQVSRDKGWLGPMHRLRPHVQSIWRGAPQAEQRRFLRHLRPWWDAHRHRTAPQVGVTIQRLIAEGRVTVAAGRPLEAAAGPELVWRPRGAVETASTPFAKLVNCTGPRGDVTRAGDPLVDALLASGSARPDAHRLGLDVDARSRVIDAKGRPQARMFAIGPLTRGAFWEIVAVPEIRVQAMALADSTGEEERRPGVFETVFTDHPREVGETYAQHFGVAVSVGGQLIAAGAACFVHALVPALFKKTASRTIVRLNAKVTGRRPCEERRGAAD